MHTAVLTGISAPPIDDVICRPNAPLLTTPEANARAATVGSPVMQKVASEARLTPARPMLMASRPGRAKAAELSEPIIYNMVINVR